jgi:hypothetical protein
VKEAVLLRLELRDCLARVQSVLVRAEGTLGKLQSVPLLPEFQVASWDVHAPCESTERESTEQDDDVFAELMSMSKAGIKAVDKAPDESLVVGEVCTFGCFSPRARYQSSQPAMPVASEHEEIDGILAPVMHIMPELQELLVEHSPPSMIGSLAVSSTPPPVELSQPLDFVDGGEKVNEAATLAPNSDALFAKELCDLLASLEVASLGSGKAIACLLAEKATEDKIKNVKEYLRSVSKKSGVTRKISTAA